MLLGFAGCDKNKKAVSQIEDLMEEYVEALNDYDSDGVLNLTNWDDDDKEYEAAEEVLDIDKIVKYDGEGFASCARYIASTISSLDEKWLYSEALVMPTLSAICCSETVPNPLSAASASVAWMISSLRFFIASSN